MKKRNFNEIYEKVRNEKDPMLEILRKRAITCALICLFMTLGFGYVLYKFTDYTAVKVIYGLIDFISLIVFLLSIGKYNQLYKENIIVSLVKAYSPGLGFNRKSGVSSYEYNKANFKEYYDVFHSEDLIHGTIDDEFTIKMSEVKTEKKETTVDSQGHTQTHYVTVFRGIYGFIDVNDKFLPPFEVCSNKFFGKYNKSRIEVDSAEFEKYYDLYTIEKVRTMEVFTADLIEKFNRFKNELKTPIQIKVQGGTLYFRLKMNDSFEASIFRESLDFKNLYHTFQLIDEPMSIFGQIFENAKVMKM